MEIHAKKVEERCRVCGRFLGYIPGLHMTQGVFMKLFRLLEDTCHQFDLQLAYTYQEKSSSSSSFTKYAEELHKLRVAKAKLAEAQDSLAALEEAVMYVVVAYGEDSWYGDPYQACPGQEAVCGENGKD